jgi:hypothetical protein
MSGLLVCDVIGGFGALALGADTSNEAWGFDTEHSAMRWKLNCLTSRHFVRVAPAHHLDAPA